MKVVCFHVQDFDKSSVVDVGYEQHLQEWYDLIRSFKFDSMAYVDATENNEVPQISSSHEFTRKKYTSVLDVISEYPTLDPIVMIAPVEKKDWNSLCMDINELPEDNFILIFGRDSGGLTNKEIRKLKQNEMLSLCNIPTPFGGAFHAIHAGTIALWEYNKKWQ